MHIVPNPPPPAPRHLLLPLSSEWSGDAANDSGIYTMAVPTPVCDLNVLVGGVVGHVVSQVQPERVNVALDLAPGRPVVLGDPTELAFAISGLLGAQLRALDENDQGDVRVKIRREGESATVFIGGSELPPLPFVRAVDPTSRGTCDPTVAHCRRLIEACGGHLDLVEVEGYIGFAIVLSTPQIDRPAHIASSKGFEARTEWRHAS